MSVKQRVKHCRISMGAKNQENPIENPVESVFSSALLRYLNLIEASQSVAE